MSSICEDTIRALQQLHTLEDEIAELKPKQEPKPELKAQIEALRAKILPVIIGHHDRMRLRGKRSIAEVRNGVCAGCHTSIPVGTVNIVRRGEDIQLCATCGRYLYLPAPPPAGAPPAVEAPQLDTEKPKRGRKKKIIELGA
ncbi:MAG: C4-type zinc ribbon domain-containing protein [Verrucomicrobiota bacterium]